MNQLEQTLTSIEVAEMVGRRHDQVMRDIKTIIDHLGGDHKSVGTYFIESNYKERMKEYGFIENIHFVLVSERRETNNPRNPYTTIKVIR